MLHGEPGVTLCSGDKKMILRIVDNKELIIKEGIYYFGLSDYPQVQDWEWNNILAFLCYEKAQGRETNILCEDKELLNRVLRVADELDGTEYIPTVAEAREKFVYHATNVTAAQKILKSGKLLSATKVYGQTGEEIALERRASGWEEPADFYEYVMFGCIVPEQYKEQIESCVPQELIPRSHYLSQRGIGLQDWNSKVAEYVEGLCCQCCVLDLCIKNVLKGSK